MKERGKFIVIEGIDGSGKSTQIKLIKERLSYKYEEKDFYFTREASDGPIGDILRSFYLNKKRVCDEKVINLLYAADRLDHITNSEHGMLKYINSGVNVISDRYYLSSMAYNSYMASNKKELKELVEYTINMNKYIMELLRPDMTIYIDLNPSNTKERFKNRKELSIYEDENKLSRIHEAYDIAIDILNKEYNDKIVSIDGNRSISEVHKDVYSIILDTLNK